MRQNSQASGGSNLRLTPVVFHTLLALAEGPLHGYAISQSAAEASGGSVQMGPGSLYGSLQRMQVAGLLQEVEAPSEADGAHASRRRYYALTKDGREQLIREARLLEGEVGVLRARGLLGADRGARS